MPGTTPGMVLSRLARGALGQRLQQRRGIGMARLLEQALGQLLLHLLAGIHHTHALRGLRHHAHVVGDEDHRHVAVAAERDQQVEDLRLDGDVERGGRLVGDQQLGIAGDRHRDHDALAHAAGQLVRKGIEPRRRGGNADLLQQLDGAAAALRARAALMHRQRLHDLVADAEGRVEAGHRLLEDHRDVLADDLAPLAVRQGQEVDAGEAHDIRRHLARPGDEAHDGEHGDALAGAGFAHHAQQLAGLEGEVDAVHRPERAAMSLEFDREVADFEQGHGGQRFSFGSSASRSPSPSRLKASTVMRMARPGNVTTHGMERIKLRASASMVPHSGVGACAP